MRILRTSVPALACLLILGTGAASAAKDDNPRAMPGHHGHTGMMGPGHGAMIGHGHGSMGCGPGGMMGYGHGHGSMKGHGHSHAQGHGSMMGHGYAHAHAHAHGSMMDHGHARAHAHGHGSMKGRVKSGFRGAAGMDPDQLSDDVLDRMGERIAQRHRTMQEIASEQDPEARRELLREHLKSKQAKRHGHGQGTAGQGRGMMGQGQGMMSRGRGMMMGQGMSMMSLNELSDEQLDEIAERMAENHERMQQLAETTDKAERRELLREHFESMQESMGGMHRRR